MVKISALPPMTTPDGDDEAPIVDDSASTTKKWTLTALKEWLQSLVGWITTAMLADDSVTAEKIDWAGTGADGGIWWEELGRTTLGSANATLGVTSFEARRHLRVMVVIKSPSASTSIGIRFNNDSGANYGYRYSADGAADTTATAQTRIVLVPATSADVGIYEIDLHNFSTNEKQGISHSSRANSGTGAPTRDEAVFKWANTAQITRIDFITSAGTWAAGSEIIILGHD